MAKKLMTQWHPAFCSAVKLELIENKADLDYTNEYNLNSKPIQIDLLVIKKSRDVEIKNEIGKIFRGHNIMEYKSPEDSLNVDTFIKVIAYACLYKASEEHINDIRLDDITITLVRERKPVKLFNWFVKKGYVVREEYMGIYYIEKEGTFPIQVIVSGKLSVEKWLTLLNNNLGRSDAERMVLQMRSLTQKDEKAYADSVLQVALLENRKLFDNIKTEDVYMCEALRELMRPELEEASKIGEERGKIIGEAIGKEREREEIILNILRKKRSAEEVAELLDISLEEVKAVEKKLHEAII